MFHLVGSRFFGTDRVDSDYDFIAANTPEVHSECLRLGLKRLDTETNRYFGHGVDVCLVPNLERSLKARDELASIPNIKDLSKSERHLKLKEIMRGL